MTTWLYGHRVVWPPCCMATSLYGHFAVWPLSCMAHDCCATTWLHARTAKWLYRWVAIQLGGHTARCSYSDTTNQHGGGCQEQNKTSPPTRNWDLCRRRKRLFYHRPNSGFEDRKMARNFAVRPPSRMATQHGHVAAWPRRCLATELYGFRAVWLTSFMAF